MNLYLVQHGEAVSKEVDPQRPLSADGREAAARMGEFLAVAGVRAERVAHSGKARARETAEILGEAIAPEVAIEVVASGLGPTDPTDWLTEAVSGWGEDSLVVGHLPFMARMASRLVTGAEGAEVAAFTPGTVLCLERRNDGEHWVIAWMVRPQLLVRPEPL